MQELQQSASVQSNSDYGGNSYRGQHNHISQTQGSSTSQQEQPASLQEDRSKTAINLIYYDTSTKSYLVSQEARQFLCEIKDKIAVIAVAGKYRTGKSFLLNRVILNKRASGFGVGPTINPCTKGLWVWSETLETQHNGERLRVLVVDSEGIGAFDEDVNHDTKIFLLALLICSTFIFNSMNTIDENAINSLSLIINLSKELQIKKSEILGESDPEDIQKYFPSFLWVVRDFSLRLIDTYGNTINQKQYLENSLQPQKGSSDAVEQKNRIRRMIQMFFKDRDCFTMVRPVENEKELQNLQQMTDNQFRPEFQQQLYQLRNRIMKKAKPKILNGKILTGEMLYELCVAYTNAINTGSVPNIQNAWSYVCQNECQRIISACLNNYESQIGESFQLSKQKLQIQVLKIAHKSLVETCVHQFRSDALGGHDNESGQEMMQELESKLRAQLSEKFKEMKKEFIRHCKVHAKKYIDEQTASIRRGISQQSFKSLDQVQDKLEHFKVEYDGPQYPGYEILISETICSLILKASDYLNMNQTQTNQFEQTRLTSKVQDLENQLKEARIEYQSEKSDLQSNLALIQAENAQLVKSEKLMQERLKIEQIENQNALQKKDKEFANEIDIKEKEIQSLKHQKDIVDLQKRQADQSQAKKFTELEKLNALIDQKLQLTEQELKDHKTKLSEKDKDLKDLQKEHYQVRIEIQDIKQKLARKDIDHQEELSKLQEQNEKNIQKIQEDLKSGSNDGQKAPVVQNNIEAAKWKKEREQMTRQINMMTEQFDQQKKLQESLLQALNRQKEDKAVSESTEQSITNSPQFLELQEKNQSLLQMNNNLSQQIVQMQQKQQQLEEDIRSLKKYKKIVNNSVAFQCKYCIQNFQKETFQDHIKKCSQDNDKNRISVLVPSQPGSNQGSNNHILQSSQRIPNARMSGIIGIGVPSPLNRQRTSTIGRNNNYYGSQNFIQTSNQMYQILVQNCSVNTNNMLCLQTQANFVNVVYVIDIQNYENYEWTITINLKEIIDFLATLKKSYPSFDFQDHRIMFKVNPPKGSEEEIQFYFENILKYEVQQLFDRLQKIPFIRDGPSFKKFFKINQQHELDDDGKDIGDVQIQSHALTDVKGFPKKDRAAEMLNQIKELKGLQRESPQPFQHDLQTNANYGAPNSEIQQIESQNLLQPDLQNKSQSNKKHKFNLNLRENNLDDEVRVTEGTATCDEVEDKCGELDNRDRFKDVIASFRHDNNSRLSQRPVSNRYNQGISDDDLDPTLEKDNNTPNRKFKEDSDSQQYQKEGDSSNILCWTQDSIHNLQTKQSPKHKLFKNLEQGSDRPTSKQANHEMSQTHSNYFNDCSSRKESQQEHSQFLNQNLNDEDLNDRAEQYPNTARQIQRIDSSNQIITSGLGGSTPAPPNRGGSRNNCTSKQLLTYNEKTNQTPQQQKQIEEDENVLSSQGTIEEQSSVRNYVNDLNAYSSPAQPIPDINYENISSRYNQVKTTSSSKKIVNELNNQTTSVIQHHKVPSAASSSHSGFIRTGTQRTAYLGNVPSNMVRGHHNTSTKHSTSSISGQRGSLKQRLSSQKKMMNPVLSNTGISSSASISKSRQKSTNMMGISNVTGYEPVRSAQHLQEQYINKKQASISMSGSAGTQKHAHNLHHGHQSISTGSSHQIKHKYSRTKNVDL